MIVALALLTARLALALLFAGTAFAKLRRGDDWRAMLAAYQLLPEALVAPVALALPLAELAVAAGLVAGLPLAGVAGAALMLVFAAAIAVNLKRGRRTLDCGCHPGGRPQPISTAIVVRNLALACVLLACALPAAPQPLDVWFVAGVAAVLVHVLLHIMALLRSFAPVALPGAR